jgi:hypothetical protein
MDAEVSTHTFLTMIIEESVCFMSCEPFFLVQLFLCGTHGIHFYLYPTFFSSTEQCAWAIISSKEFKSWVTCISFAVRENRIICCQIFCDLLLKSAFEWIFNVVQLILVKIKWNIKWKYLIQKFHDICLSYYFNTSQITLKVRIRS